MRRAWCGVVCVVTLPVALGGCSGGWRLPQLDSRYIRDEDDREPPERRGANRGRGMEASGAGRP